MKNSNASFNITKNRINDAYIYNEIDCLQTIVLNISEYCNLKCKMCPRSNTDIYPNRKLFMNLKTIRKIRERLDEINYCGTVSISGNGEPCYNPFIYGIIGILTEKYNCKYPKYKIKLLTNGYPDIVYSIISKMGVKILVSVHIIQDLEKIKEKFKNIDDVVFRNHDPNDPDNELKITNRSGICNKNVSNSDTCYYPLYKMMIDYDGSYLMCADDWLRKTKNDNYNVFKTSIKDWFCILSSNDRKDKYFKFKNQLLNNKRKEINELCAKCDCNGLLMGSKMYIFYKEKMNG